MNLELFMTLVFGFILLFGQLDGMKKALILLGFSLAALLLGSWGFFGHRKINRLAVFTLPPEMVIFYKSNIAYLEEASVNPDRRRYAMPEEGPRHYIDLDDYGDSALHVLPRYWSEAVAQIGEDSLMLRGILPWHINRVFLQLKDAFLLQDPSAIVRVSAELGHYVADAHVPLHTTSNHDGQKTGQVGIHGFWESRLPELFSGDYDFFTGPAVYITDVQSAAWKVVSNSNRAVDSVLTIEQLLSARRNEQKFSFETRGRQTVKVFSSSYSKEYHQQLNGMVERQMRASVKMIGSLWYTAWVDGGQPELDKLINYRPTVQELQERREELERWKQQRIKARVHEVEDSN